MAEHEHLNGAELKDTVNISGEVTDSNQIDGTVEPKDNDIVPSDNVSVNHSDSADNNSTSDNKPKRHGMENLIPFTALTEEEQRQMAIKGGKASGEARRKKKHMREIAQSMLAHNMTEDQIDDVLGTAKSLLDGDLSVAAVLTARMIQAAADGDIRAFETLRDTAGYKPKDQVEVENISDADKALLDRIAQRVGLHNSANTGQITG